MRGRRSSRRKVRGTAGSTSGWSSTFCPTATRAIARRRIAGSAAAIPIRKRCSTLEGSTRAPRESGSANAEFLLEHWTRDVPVHVAVILFTPIRGRVLVTLHVFGIVDRKPAEEQMG